MRKSYRKSELASFAAAWNGLKIAVRDERHMKFHLIAFGLALALGVLLGCTWVELSLLVLVSILVVVAEMVNTAFEKLCDLVQPEIDPRIGMIKDVAAGAVLLSAVAALIVAAFIFIPKII